MPRDRLGGADRDFISQLAERDLERERFAFVVQRRARAMRIDVVNITAVQSRIFERVLYGSCRAFAGFERRSHMVGVGGMPIALNFGVDMCAACLRVFEFFENENSSAFGDDEAVTV